MLNSIPSKDLPEREQKFLDYADILYDMVESGIAESMYEAAQIYNRSSTLETRLIEIYKAGYNNGLYNWYFLTQVTAAIRNQYSSENYTVEEITAAHQNLCKKKILYGRDFNEGKGVKYIYQTIQYNV